MVTCWNCFVYFKIFDNEERTETAETLHKMAQLAVQVEHLCTKVIVVHLFPSLSHLFLFPLDCLCVSSCLLCPFLFSAFLMILCLFQSYAMVCTVFLVVLYSFITRIYILFLQDC